MATAHKNSMRGLTVFITDVRNSTSKEDEEKKVNKEMAKIRKRFKEAKDIDGYDRRKYVCKLLYMYLLGYDIDVGHMEALALLSSLKFQEKLIGYLSLSILLNETHSMLPLLIQSIQNDLQARNEYHQTLALTAIGNIGGKEMAESVAPIVQKMLVSKATRNSIKKKAALCLLRLARKNTDLLTPDVWLERFNTLLDEQDLGILTSVMGLLLGLAFPNPKPYESLVKKAISILTKILLNREYTKDYIYYNMANPWLQVKLLRFLSYYGPCEDKASRGKLNEILGKILGSADVAKGQTVNHKNALNAVLFEAIALVIHLDDDRELTRQAGTLLGRFISAKETNIRYLALEAMGRFAALDNETAAIAKKHQETVILALNDPDISIRKRALDLLYGLCDKNNSKAIVSELLNYLATADFAIREDLVLKIAILGEKFAAHYSWYVDVILQLISLAGDFVSDEIWFRVVQIVTNHEDIQEYAAKTAFEALKHPSCHETTVKVGGYILGEFGHLIAENPTSGPKQQFDLLHSKFHTCSISTKGLLLSTYIKFLNPYPELSDKVREVFKQYQSSIDTELQQRACEYLKLAHASSNLLQTVWDVMPAFPERDMNRIGLTDSNQDLNNSARSSRAPSQSGSHGNSTANLLGLSEDTPVVTSPSQSKKSDPTKDLDSIFGVGSTTTTTTTPTSPGGSGFNTGSYGSSSNLFGTSGVGSPSNSTNNINPFGLGNANNTSSSSSLTTTTGYGSNSNDNSLVSTSSSTTSKTGGLSDQEIGEYFKKSSMLPEGVLYQDEFIKVGFKSEFSKGYGRIALYYFNATNQPLTAFRTFVSPLGSLNVELQSVAPVIDPNSQLQQLGRFACTGPFAEPPTMQLSFVANGKPVSFTIKLPILLARFIEPMELNGPEFFQHWKQITAGPPLELQSVVKAPGPIDMNVLNKTIATVFRLTVLKGVDPNVNNLVAAGILHTSNGQQVTSLLRIETNPTAQMYRITLRTTNAQVSTGFKDALVSQLS